MSSHDSSPLPGEILLHHWPLLAACLIGFNDFVLKRQTPGWVSGKLSDLGLCFFLPVLLVALMEWVLWLVALLRRQQWRPPSAWSWWLACALSGVYFTLLQLSPGWSRLHVATLSSLFPSMRFVATPDPTDLIALIMLPLAFLYLRKQRKAR